jgi:hypothetical protein
LDLRADLRGYLSFEFIELPEAAELTLFSIDFSIDELRNF